MEQTASFSHNNIIDFQNVNLSISQSLLNFLRGCIMVLSFNRLTVYLRGSASRVVPLFTRHRRIFTVPIRSGESVATMRSRLLYESRKRGNLENGIILASFADKHLGKMTEEQLKAYDHLINTPECDWDIFYWVVGEKEAPSEYRSDVLEMLQRHAKNYGRNLRNQQPNIHPHTV
ncbi:Succinate dehydrogenase assembly factor 2, mitochondrial [Echinococcus granulosus]|uniref:Succinate dehydrogenase assembly factor 2, mitochondrial n=2 Tax=Echinococcus granulosus TaxID=6210 RepID=A0A068WG29_ECHGR|nr:Succinate dehydrogenase assembly factor 2, mitochondrial [Echinococcus granulosus]CDS17378.1 succinate dehydrogenase assembly factor 2 [Echinococcus granulosus]